MKFKFARLDCDNVGDKIELSLYELDTEKAQRINNLIRKNIAQLAKEIEKELNAQILLIGSDDILFKTHFDSFDLEKLNFLKSVFFERTEITLSIGIGEDLISAMRNLDIAKKMGKNRIFGDNTTVNSGKSNSGISEN
jgi:hypothetical protein